MTSGQNLSEALETFDLPTCCLGMSPLAKEYRRKAEVAEALAEVTHDQIAKKIQLEAAVRWHQLAHQVEEKTGKAALLTGRLASATTAMPVSRIFLGTILPLRAFPIHHRPMSLP
jgi:hypothetical protein